MSFSYVLTTSIGQVRFNIADTNPADFIFTDAEISHCLGKAGGNVNIATGYVLLALASDRSKVAHIKVIGKYKEDLGQIAQEIRSQAEIFFDIEKVPRETTGGGVVI